MKKIFSCLAIIFLVTLFSCKKDQKKSMTVIRDCSGTYLRLDEKDYQVCNLEKVSSFADGRKVSVIFKKIDECNGSAKDGIFCTVVRPSEGWIEVDWIK